MRIAREKRGPAPPLRTPDLPPFTELATCRATPTTAAGELVPCSTRTTKAEQAADRPHLQRPGGAPTRPHPGPRPGQLITDNIVEY